ncbi:hypothetical protein CDAR_538601 [Caerostris darwini]|uniref:Uncharacterized protein n=1 Tax=Caerostris darwini TaxID=1538125 RepID=A0AAV4T4A9_9ARAC|nr:hypothetical protein CDAR_538601 [Caerostris darwini]
MLAFAFSRWLQVGPFPSLQKFQDFDVGVSRKVLAGSPKRNLILDRVLPAGLGQQNLELTLVTSLLCSGRFRNSKPGPALPSLFLGVARCFLVLNSWRAYVDSCAFA